MKNKKKRKKEKIVIPTNKVMLYCLDNVETMDLNNNEEFEMYNSVTNYLMNKKICNFNEREARFLTYFFAKWEINKLDKELDKQVKIELVEHEILCEKGDSEVCAICFLNEDCTSTIMYSDIVLKNIMSDDMDKVTEGIKTVVHETVHAFYNKILKTDYFKLKPVYAEKAYIIALEKVMRKYKEEFYKENYRNLLSENNANRIGLISAINIFKDYNKEIINDLNVDVLKKRIRNYVESPKKDSKKIFDIRAKKGYNLLELEFDVKNFLEKYPSYIEEYPVLKIAYNEDGTRKSISQLLDDREKRLQGSNASKNSINKLFYTILDNRYTTVKDDYNEIEELYDYIHDKGTDDHFLNDLMKTRLIKILKKSKRESNKNNENSKNSKNVEEVEGR